MTAAVPPASTPARAAGPAPDSVGELLARLPTTTWTRAGARSEDWLADAARLLDRDLDDVARARLLEARSLVRAAAVAPAQPSVAAQLYLDAARAATLYEEAGMSVEAATSYATAAAGAAYSGNLDVALDIAVRAIASFSTVDAGGHDHRARARLAIRLGILCAEFFDVAAARDFLGMAADSARSAALTDLWSAATHSAADVVEARLLDGEELDERTRSGLVDDLERLAGRLLVEGDGAGVRQVDARRLLATAAMERGDVDRAAALLERAWEAAGDPPSVGSVPELLRARASCLAALGRPEEALPLLDAALDELDPAWDLAGVVVVLGLRSRVRRASGDLAGAVEDMRRITAETFSRHQHHVGGFLGQVLSRARVEGERRALAERAEELARTVERDPLTGVGNRRSVERLLEGRDPGDALGVALVDLDEFKGVNDTFGHELGDRLLVALAGLLADLVGDAGHVARWGGEEFVVVLPGVARAAAEEVGERVRRGVEDRTWTAGAVGLRLTVSVGVAHARVADAPDLLTLADEAMYDAKAAGRNRTVSVRPRSSSGRARSS